jgi:hypothetical protein
VEKLIIGGRIMNNKIIRAEDVNIGRFFLHENRIYKRVAASENHLINDCVISIDYSNLDHVLMLNKDIQVELVNK